MASIEIHAHRGCPSLLPENTLAGFEKAIDCGAIILELDVVVSREGRLIVSHDPYMRAGLCLDRNGNRIPKEEEGIHNIFEMSHEVISGYEVGAILPEKFPHQQTGQHFKPSFLDFVKMVAKHEGVKANIEVKSDRKWYGEYQPDVSEYAAIVKKEIRALRQLEVPFMVQSFDTAFLNQLYKLDPNIEYGLLVEQQLEVEKSLERLLFTPTYFNPDHELLDEVAVSSLKERGFRVVPWTVNEKERVQSLLKMGVDGVITDYPQVMVSEFIQAS